MKHSFAKLFCLLLAVLFTLTGCNLIKIDGVMQAQENLAKAQKNYSTVIAEYDGGSVNIFDVTAAFNSNYNYMAQMYYYFYGSASLSDEDLTSLKQSVLQSAVTVAVVQNKAAELGISLSDEEIAECEQNAQESWEANYDNVLADYATGETDEEKDADAKYQLYLAGITPELLLYQEKAYKIVEKVEEYLRGEIEDVSDEDLETAYAERVESDTQTYTDAPGSFGSAMTSEDYQAYWVPEGYRTVKHILVKPETEVLSAVTTARKALTDAENQLATLEEEYAALTDDDEESEDSDEALSASQEPRDPETVLAEIEDLRAQLPDLQKAQKDAEDACIASVQERLDEIILRIEAGEDFDALIAEYGEDPGMQSEPAMTNGYYVSLDSTNWDKNFQKTAMALAAVGDVSDPVISTSGVHIIRYESDVTPGEPGLEAVRDTLYAEVLEEQQDAHSAETIDGWVEAANPQYYYDKWTYAEQ